MQPRQLPPISITILSLLFARIERENKTEEKLNE